MAWRRLFTSVNSSGTGSPNDFSTVVMNNFNEAVGLSSALGLSGPVSSRAGAGAPRRKGCLACFLFHKDL